jgi:hypothetical protein
LQNAARRKSQNLSRKGPLSDIVCALQRSLLHLFNRLRLRVIIASSRQRGNPVKVTPIPVAELSASFWRSDNGGAYERLGETSIIGSAAARQPVDSAPKRVEPLPFGVAEIDNAIVCGEGIIWKKTADGLFAVFETLIGASTPRSILPLRRSLDGTLDVDENVSRRSLPTRYTYAFLRQVSDNNYGHWIIEGLPKVAILADHFDIKSLKFIVTRHMVTRQSGPMRMIYRDSLAALGIESHQIVPMGREAVEVARLLYPLPLTAHPWVKAPRIIEVLERLRDTVAVGRRGPRRIYSSRAFARKRRLLNEADILRVLKDFDVTPVHSERNSFVEQVRLFSAAELVIGNYGANLTNAVFSPRGVAIFAIAPEAMGNDFFWDLANLKSGKYFSLHGKEAHPNPNADSDFYIDPGKFRCMLEDACRTIRGSG